MLDAAFRRRLEFVDRHGAVVEHRETVGLFSRDLAEWCAASPTNFVGWGRHGKPDGPILADRAV